MTPPYDIILSGPINGTTDYKERFAVTLVKQLAKRRTFTAEGAPRPINIWNPAELGEGRDYEWYMWQCLDAIRHSPRCTLVRMKGWHCSLGAVAEWALCRCLGRTIVDE